MADTHKSPRTTRRERWLHRITLLSMALFTVLGVYVLYFPTEALILAFGALMLVTLVLGILSGIVAVYAE
ncbi:MAG: hypothetical protein K8S97_13415 [Anaerolineae bacterium]|nr:hypothetical protein [Anaerolineae bacterium]